MRRSWLTIGLIAWLPAAASAQTPGASSQVPQPDTRVQRPAQPAQDAVVTLTGCLTRSGAAPDGRPPEAGSPEGTIAVGYVLTVPGADAGTPATRYTLVAGPGGLDLAPHVGRQVEVRGRLRVEPGGPEARTNKGVSPSMPGGSSGMETLPPPRPDAATPSHAPVEAPATSAIAVTTVRVVAQECPAQEGPR
jgi:hypothetical protein